MFSKAQPGDKAWHFLRGWGTILDIGNDDDEYPVKWREYGEWRPRSFTLDGYEQSAAKRPVLYWDEVSIDPPEQPARPLPVDTKVLVWATSSPVKTRAYFHSHGPNGGIITYAHGNTSWTSGGGTQYWEHWEVYTEDEE